MSAAFWRLILALTRSPVATTKTKKNPNVTVIMASMMETWPFLERSRNRAGSMDGIDPLPFIFAERKRAVHLSNPWAVWTGSAVRRCPDKGRGFPRFNVRFADFPPIWGPWHTGCSKGADET